MKPTEQILQRDVIDSGGYSPKGYYPKKKYPEPNEWKVSRENGGDIERELDKVKELYDEQCSIYNLLKDSIDKLYKIAVEAIKAKYE